MLRFYKCCIWTWLLTTVPVISGDGDPCSSTVPKLHHLNARYKHYSIMESYHQDSSLIPGWYSVEDLKMLDELPGKSSDCGTEYPMYLKGDHPEETNVEVTRTACQVFPGSYCAKEIDVKIIKCPNDYYQYFLRATPPNSGYCFGVGVEGSAPTYQPVIGEIVTMIDTETLWGRDITRAYFKCKFSDSSEKLFYRVSWNQDNDQMLLSDFGNSSSSQELRLTEKLFKQNGMQLGHNLSCSVEAYNFKHGTPGPRSSKSIDYFAGIKVLNSSLSFATDEKDESKRTILLQPTVPIGCVLKNCNIELLAKIPEESEIGICSGISLDLARCGIKIASKDVLDAPIKLVLQTAETGQYKLDRHAKLYLRIADHQENLMWPNYQLQPISIHLKADGVRGLSDGKKCQSNNDPYIYTFDDIQPTKHSYKIQPSHYTEDVYTLFKNDDFKAEVQIQIARCPSPWRNAFCNCGVAVRSGQDIYQINACNGVLFMGYTICGDAYLKVKALKNKKYQIFLPYGSYIQVNLHIQSNTMLMNVHVYPSPLDVGHTRGLCGTLDGNPANDFHDEQGFQVSEESFVETWRVKNDANNMLHANYDVSTNTVPYEQGVCICPEHTGNHVVPPIRPVSCDKNAVASCSKGKAVSIHDCPAIARTRRSVDEEPRIPVVEVGTSNHHARHERAADSQTWTQETAETFCRGHMKEAPAYELCKDVPNVITDVAVFDCISDIMVNGTTDWATISRHTMQSVCGTELARNMTLRKSEYNTPSVAETIERVLCENECSGVGTCAEGVCECPDIYGGSDCSIDLTKPPTVYGLLNDGFCDEREYPCTHTYLFAYPLSDSSTLTCRLVEIYISWAFERISVATYTAAAEFSTLVEAICPLEGLRRKRNALSSNDVFIAGFAVSISNDGGVLYSEENDLFIYNSTCINVDKSSENISFVLLEGYCWIDGQCVIEGTVAENDNCSVCDIAQSVRSWSTAMGTKDCLSTSAIPVIASTNEASEIPSIQTTDSENPTTTISTPGSYGRTTLHTTMAGTSDSKSSKSITVSNTILMGSETTKTETKTPDFETTHTSTSTSPESTRTMMPSTNAVHSASTTITQASVDQSSTPNTIALTQSSKSIHSFSDFITTKRFSSTKENVDTSTPTSSYNGLYSSDTTSLGFSETESETLASTDESPPAQSKNSLWMIGAIVPSVIVLAIIITVGVLLYLKKSTKKLRIQSSTNLHVGQFTALSRQNTTTSIATTSDMSFTCANPSDYHPPPKPDMSFEEST